MPEREPLTIVLDVDGTLCPVRRGQERYEDLVPYADMIRLLREHHAAGTRIVLYTSRNMNSYHGSLGMINAHTAKVLLSWLEKWDIPYDEIVYGKPWPGRQGFYVDDRAVRPDEFLRHTPEELMRLCSRSRPDAQTERGTNLWTS